MMTTYIRVQYPRLFRRRLDIRNRRLKDVAFVQPPVQSLGEGAEHISIAHSILVF